MLLRLKVILLISSIVVLSACAGTVFKPIAPEVEIVSVKIGKINFPSTNIYLSVLVENPNDFDIAVAYIDLKLHVMDSLISHEYLSDIEVLSSHQKKSMRIPVKVDMVNALTLMLQLTSTDQLTYKVSGRVKLEDYTEELPFTYQGKFDTSKIDKLTQNNNVGPSKTKSSYRF